MSEISHSSTLAGDNLFGASAISIFYFGDDSAKNVRRVYHLASKGALITYKMGETLCARKSTILKNIEEQEALTREAQESLTVPAE
jgi:hypothetical protein